MRSPINTSVNRQTVKPVDIPRTRRRHALPVLTSMPTGKIVPVAAIPLLREDSMLAQLNVRTEMAETAELLMNRVFLRLRAFVVPYLAFERFERSRDQLDRSYMGQPQVVGGDVVPFFDTHARGAQGANPIYDYLGLHGKATDQVNTAYAEAYNAIVNHLRKNRSPELPLRDADDTSLAEAFWPSSRFDRIVPDFAQDEIDGQVALNVVAADMPVRGIRIGSAGTAGTHGGVDTLGNSGAMTGWVVRDLSATPTGSQTHLLIEKHATEAWPSIYAELQQNGITVSLSNIAMAQKTVAFAKLRKQYSELPEEYLIDMMMSGLSVDDLAMTQPLLLADQNVAFSQVQRFATDAANLAEKAVSGFAGATLRLRCPRVATGGVVMVVAEAVPEQLFERARDPLFHLSEVEALPEFVRDFGDPEKVEVVYNRDIDTAHATPDGVFGYEPKNDRWNRFGPRIGGKFLRPDTNTTEDEERQRLWAMEKTNPVLSADFYIVSAPHNKPFLDTEADPFELTISGGAIIEGNTQFGVELVESGGDYDAIAEQMDTERIEKA